MRKLLCLFVVLAATLIAWWFWHRDDARRAEVAPTDAVSKGAAIEATELSPVAELVAREVELEASERAPSDARPVAERARDRIASIRVVDAATGEPIERFGARASRRVADSPRVEGVRRTSISAESHAQGYADFEVEPKETVVQVDAPGYAPFEGELLDVAFRDAQVVELTRGGAVAGRVLLAGRAAPSVRVSCERAVLAQAGQHVSAAGYDLSRFVASETTDTTDGDGRFRFDRLASGTYALELRGPGEAHRLLPTVVVDGPATTDVGDIPLLAGCAIRGRVLLPEDANTERACVQLNQGRHELTCELDGELQFEFAPVRAGRWTLQFGTCLKTLPRNNPHVRGRFSGLADGYEYELTGGEQRNVVLDLRHAFGSKIEMSLRINGRALSGARVELLYDSGDPQLGHDRTDAAGLIAWWQEPVTTLDFRVVSELGMPLGRFERDGDSVFAAGVRVELDIAAAELSVDWHAVTAGEEQPLCSVLVSDPTDWRNNGSARLAPGSEHDVAERRSLELGPVFAGDVEVVLRLHGKRPSGRLTPTERSNLAEREYVRRLTLLPGARVHVAFTDADRVP